MDINYFLMALTAALIMIVCLIIIIGYGALIRITFDDEDKLIGYELISGFSISILLLSIYFIVPIKLEIIAQIWLLLGVIIIFYLFYKKISFINYKIISVSIIPILCFLIYGILYGSNFYVFRGNIWDWFNYNSMAVGYSKFKISDFPTLIADGNALSFVANSNIINRPFVVALPSAILSIIKIDNFVVMYFYKAFLLSIILNGFIIFLLDFIIDLKKVFLISLSILFSSWIFYVVEIDALSNLAYLAFLPIIASILYRSHDFFLKISPIPIGIIFSASFCIYPEFSIICIGGLFFTLAINFLIKKGYLYIAMDNVKITIVTSCLIVLPFWNSTVYFLGKQIIGGVTTKVDWWGYYGGFIFGPNSPVINPEVVLKIKEEVNRGGSILDNSYLMNIAFDYLLMILPSVFGFFHLLSNPFVVYPVFLFALLICIIYLSFFKTKYDSFLWIRAVSFLLIILFFLLIFVGSYWGAIKALSYLMAFMTLVFPVLLFKKKNGIVRYVLLAMFCCLPIFTLYKYSVYNHGIGMFDGFPSILKPESKTNFVWNFNFPLYQTCKLVNVKVKDPFYRHFILLNLENYNIPYVTSFPLMESYGVGKVITQSNLSNISYDCFIE